MSFWTCSACTYVNQGPSHACDVCQQSRKPASAASSLFSTTACQQQDNSSRWGCRACTFLNKDVHKSCDICGTAKSDVSLDAFAEIDSAVDEGQVEGNKFWPLRSSGLSRPESCDSNINLQANRETSSQSGPSSILITSCFPKKQKLENEANATMESNHGSSGVVSNSLLGQLHLEKIARSKQSGADFNEESASQHSIPVVSSIASASSSVGDDNQSIVILTYNVWFREDLELLARMNAIGAIILEHRPHLICLQEVTPNIYNIFQRSTWWQEYQCSVVPELATKRAYFCIQLSRISITEFVRKPYHNSVMGRELCIAKLDLAGGKQLVVATSHLESPCPAPPTWDQMFSSERVSQAKEAFNQLKNYANVVFGGDMNWDDKLDGNPPFPEGWCDAWMNLRPTEEGLTYDSKANPMLSGSRLQKRLDRLFCFLEDFKLESIERVGTMPIPGVSFQKEKKLKKQVQKMTLPVLPSDHFGLLLKIRQRY